MQQRSTAPRLGRRYVSLLALVLILAGQAAGAERIKDIATIEGVRANQLIGYGLVVGLSGTGDRTRQAPFTQQSLRSMLTQLGVTLPPEADARVDNIAAVMVTAELPPFVKPGQTIDITVSSIANAESLRGGTLIMTPLKGSDNNVYAMAQGNLVVGGFGAEGNDGSQITVNIPSVGRVPNGATVERAVPSGMAQRGSLQFYLNNPDFTTASRVVEVINKAYGNDTAAAVDAATIEVDAPDNTANRIAYIAAIENLEVNPGQAPAKVIVSSRTGTVIIGSQVRVMPAAVSHGSLIVRISERPEVDQPAPFGAGETREVPRSEVEITEEGNRMFLFEPGVTLDSLVEAVNQVGAAPGDLVAILQALKRAGALRAELEVI